MAQHGDRRTHGGAHALGEFHLERAGQCRRAVHGHRACRAAGVGHLQRQRAARTLGVGAVHHHVAGGRGAQRTAAQVHRTIAQRRAAARLQGACRQLDTAREAVIACQHQRAAAELRQLAGPGDVVAPRVECAEAALGRVHGHRHIAVEAAVAVGGREQVQAAPAFRVVHDGVARRHGRGLEHHPALQGVQVGQAGLQQHFRALGNHSRTRSVAGLRETEGHAPQVLGAVRRIVSEPVRAGRLRMGELPQVGGCFGAGGGHHRAARLLEGRCLAGRVRAGRDARGGHGLAVDASADHIQGRVHAGQDAALAQFQPARDHFLEAFRHQVGHGDGTAHRLGRVAAGEAAVGGRRGAARREQGGHHLHGAAPAPGPRVLVEALGGLRGAVLADPADEIHRRAESGVGAAAHARVVAAVVVHHGRRIGRDRGDGRRLLRGSTPCGRERPHAVAHAIGLAAAVVQVGQEFLRGRAAARGIDHILDIARMHLGIEHRPVGRVAGNAAPGGGRDGREGTVRGGAHARVHQQRGRLPDREEARQHPHAGIGLERGVARIAALVRRGVVHEGRNRRFVGYGSGVRLAESLRGRGNGADAGTTATAGGEREGSGKRQDQGTA